MIRYIAFLRAINVGGHNVKMDELRRFFKSLKFKNVETFIASGNVIFMTETSESETLEKTIEQKLSETLKYEVSTFLRTEQQIAEIASYKPFGPVQMETAVAYNVGFLKEKLSKQQTEKVFEFKSDIDDFHVHDREMYWICKTRQSDSSFDAKKLERAITRPVTLRSIKTVYRLTAKYPPSL
jgi:uncharacterized protein (DUF1697 family)